MEELANKLADTGNDTRQRLASMLTHVVEEGEQLLASAQRSGSEQFGVARDRFEAGLGRARAELAAVGETAHYKVRRAARIGGHAVHEHPFAAIGVAAFVGAMLTAVLLRRR